MCARGDTKSRTSKSLIKRSGRTFAYQAHRRSVSSEELTVDGSPAFTRSGSPLLRRPREPMEHHCRP